MDDTMRAFTMDDTVIQHLPSLAIFRGMLTAYTPLNAYSIAHYPFCDPHPMGEEMGAQRGAVTCP